jgi:glycosyltransferase involved in cell wall biosynthesis
VVTFHDVFALESPQWYSRNFVILHRTMMSRLARTSVHLIAVSQYTKDRLTEFFHIPESKITVIHHGIDPAFFNVAPAAVCAAAVALRLPTRRYLLFVGSLEPRKNLARLLSAWSLVQSNLPADLWLVVAGSGDPAVYKNAGIAELPPRVHLTGYVPEQHLPGLYAGSTGLLYPSLAEGFGFPPVEAMAAGVPVLTSSVSALPEICGTAAHYVNPFEVEDIAQGIRLLSTDESLRVRLSVAGPVHARKFNWQTTADSTIRLLRQVSFGAAA